MRALLCCSLIALSLAVRAVDLSAVADGKADAAPVIQALVDSGAGRIDLPKGVYRLNSTVVINLDKTGFTGIEGHGVARLVMAAAGPALKFKGTHAGSADPASVKPEVWTQELMPVVDGLHISGEHEEADGIEAQGTHEITITRTTISECRHAVHLVERNRNFIISACHFYKNRGIGVFYDNVNLHQSNITGSHISYCNGGGIVSHGGNVRNVQISGCDMESNMSANDPPTANVLLDSTGGSIGEVAITGCTVQHSNKAPGCANIRIIGAGTDEALKKRTGNEYTREGNITIANNVFSDIQCNVHVKSARGVTITGNTFWEGFEQDLLVEDSEHVVMASNNFDRNPRYAVNGFGSAENNGVIIRGSRDCSFTGNVISGVMRHRAAVDVSSVDRLNFAQNSILDSEGAGLRLEKVNRSLISDNIIRDDRPEAERSKEPSLHVIGGRDNHIGSNLLGNGQKVE